MKNTDSPQTTMNDDDMPAEIDFTKAEVGKFYRPNAAFHIPIYLDEKIQRWLVERAAAKGIAMEQVANELLRREIEIIEAMK